ncbi:TetR/AcrR family transcriptional regulator [Litorivivens sp.]|uniref:TetR/AcrR family transcriptional regulator n=1 Tax=Litorivivens sp. TaxID=2020868 RepID=UPI003569C024
MTAAAQHRLNAIAELAQRASREERREQLIKVAAYIVEFEGIDALKHARIAELAGCGRPLVYSYFPKKSDLYFAISESFYQRLEQQFTCEEQYQAIKGFLAGDSSRSASLEALIWDVIDEYGCAGLILRAVPEINEDFSDYHRELVARYEFRWHRYFLELGVDALSARLLLDNCTAVTKNFALAYSRGELDRGTSLRRTLAALGALITLEIERIQKRSKR